MDTDYDGDDALELLYDLQPDEVPTARRVLAHTEFFDDDSVKKAYKLYARYAVLKRLHGIAGRHLALSGGMGLAAHLGAVHRPVRNLHLHAVPPAAPVDVVQLDDLIGRGEDGLNITRSLSSIRYVSREGPDAVHLDLAALLGWLEARIRVQVEASESGRVKTMEIPLQAAGLEPLEFSVCNVVTIFADIVHRIITSGSRYVRAEDILDAWLCTQIDPLDGVDVALHEVFERHGAELPPGVPDTLTEEFTVELPILQKWYRLFEEDGVRHDVTLAAAVADVRGVQALGGGW